MSWSLGLKKFLCAQNNSLDCLFSAFLLNIFVNSIFLGLNEDVSLDNILIFLIYKENIWHMNLPLCLKKTTPTVENNRSLLSQITYWIPPFVCWSVCTVNPLVISKFLFLLYLLLLGRLPQRAALMNSVLIWCPAGETDGLFVILTKHPQLLIVKTTVLFILVGLSPLKSVGSYL